jgi:methyl-accepting chemotaxis protein
MTLSNWKIGGRIVMILGAAYVVVIIIVGSVWFVLSDLETSVSRLYAYNVDGSLGLGRAQNALWELRYGEANFQLGDLGSRAKIRTDAIKWTYHADEGLKVFSAVERSAEEKAAAAGFAESFRKYVEARPRWFELIEQGKFEEAKEYQARNTTPLGAATVNLLGEQIDVQERQMKSAVEEVQQRAAASKLTFAAVAAGVLALGAVLGVLLVRSITRPLGESVRLANAIAAGGLNNSMRVEGRDEIAQLQSALDSMQTSLRGIVSEVRDRAHSVASAAADIARGNTDLSNRTEEQASSLEETASSMEELTATVRQNADNARHANQMMLGASDVASRAGEVMNQAVEAMNEIWQASKKISEIIGVIDGIAFQTNILALNAAVEAARAGDQGRGFAVVATEVRALAQRSAAAAKEIRGLIENSTQRVAEGGRHIGLAGETMGEVMTSVKRGSDIVSQIAAASRDQLSGIEQVGRALAQMDQVVQQNATLVEESAAAAATQAAQADQLVLGVSRFVLDDAQSAAHGARGEPIEARPEEPSPETTLADSADERRRIGFTGT